MGYIKTFIILFYFGSIGRDVPTGGVKGAANSRKKKISKKYNIGVIDLKFTQYIPMMATDIVYK